MKFKIKNIDVLKAQLTKMRDAVGEFAAVRFKKDGIKIMSMDGSSALASQMFISKENLVDYQHEPIKNIAVNLYAFLDVLEMFDGSVEFALDKDGLSLSAENKAFNLEFMDLESDYEFSEFKPKTEWKLDKNISGINKIFTYMDNGPLIINSANEGFELDWIVAPIIRCLA